MEQYVDMLLETFFFKKGRVNPSLLKLVALTTADEDCNFLVKKPKV